MDNLEWLKEVKKADDDWNKLHNFKIDNLVKGDEGNEYRMVKALEIIAEALIDTRNIGIASIEVYKDLVLDVHKLEKRIIKMEEGGKVR